MSALVRDHPDPSANRALHHSAVVSMLLSERASTPRPQTRAHLSPLTPSASADCQGSGGGASTARAAWAVFSAPVNQPKGAIDDPAGVRVYKLTQKEQHSGSC